MNKIDYPRSVCIKFKMNEKTNKYIYWVIY